MRPSSRINVSSKSGLNCSLLISYIYSSQLSSFVCERVRWRSECGCVSFFVPSELKTFWNKSMFMLLHLICIALMGIFCPADCVWCSGSGHPDKFVFRWGCVGARARVCVAPAFVQQLRIGALSFSPVCRSPLCAHTVAPVSLKHAAMHNGGNNLHNRSASPGCLFTLWW